jgi:hypothetical protein
MAFVVFDCVQYVGTNKCSKEMIRMTIAIWGASAAVCRRKGALKAAAAVVGIVACSAGIAGAIVAPIMILDNHGKVSALTSALAAGDKVVKDGDNTFYEIQCTGPGQANAFKITIDPATGNKVVTDKALVGYPQWPLDRWYGHSVPAGHCSK